MRVTTVAMVGAYTLASELTAHKNYLRTELEVM